MFDRMRVLGGEGHGRCESVVNFVDPWVYGREMEEAVGIVEEDFTEEDAKNDIECHFAKGGEFVVEAIGWFAGRHGAEGEEDYMNKG